MICFVTWQCPVLLALTFNFDAAKGALKEAELQPNVLSSVTLNAFFCFECCDYGGLLSWLQILCLGCQQANC